jgi:hypothetical protein
MGSNGAERFAFIFSVVLAAQRATAFAATSLILVVLDLAMKVANELMSEPTADLP